MEDPQTDRRSQSSVRRPRSSILDPRSSIRRLSRVTARRIMLPLCLLSTLLATGCGYMLGSPYQAELRTVHVPIFESELDRRGVEFLLTEAVHREIQKRTHFRLARPPHADTQLTGRIVQFRKDVLGRSGFNDPRELQTSLFLEVTWQDLRSGRILAQQHVPLAPEVVHLQAEATFAPEIGQSLATAQQETVTRLARQIVELMETPW